VLRPDDRDFLSSAATRLGVPRRPSGLGEIAAQVNWLIIAGFLIVLALCLYGTGVSGLVGLSTFGFVLVGWLFSLTLHEFGHAATAFLSGDRSYSTRRYLTANPLLYVHPVLSILFPLLILVFGGIGLPGGAVYLQRGLVSGRARQSLISLAGPAANFVVLLALVALFQLASPLGALHLLSPGAAAAIAFLAFLQVFAIVINLIPIPGLDGYGVIEPYLSYQTRQSFEAIRPYTFIIIFALFFLVPFVGAAVSSFVQSITGLFGIDPFYIFVGYSNFRFWLGPARL
jgi:Zn-dependent protease